MRWFLDDIFRARAGFCSLYNQGRSRATMPRSIQQRAAESRTVSTRNWSQFSDSVLCLLGQRAVCAAWWWNYNVYSDPKDRVSRREGHTDSPSAESTQWEVTNTLSELQQYWQAYYMNTQTTDYSMLNLSINHNIWFKDFKVHTRIWK